ncbi:hypothetical protein V6M85_08665 [Sulfolobus tengchongensis]|uniref:Uncharacterized protein n=1 Tax=Sulfolobus tengchongensis TaxID=207809 RepID=A0AAX4KYP3_9CREN
MIDDKIIFMEVILTSSFLLIIATILHFYVQSKLPNLFKDLEKVLFIAKLEALLSLIQLLSSDKVSTLIEGTVISKPLNIKVEDIANYISTNWDGLKDLIDMLNNKIRNVDRIIFLSQELKNATIQSSNENKLSVILLFLSALFLLLNFINIAFIFSGLALGTLIISIVTSLNNIKHAKELALVSFKYLEKP